MSSNFKQRLESDSALKADRAQLAKLMGDKETRTARLSDLDQTIESAAGDIRELVENLVAGGEGFAPVAVNAMRDEREQCVLFLRALGTAIPKLQQRINSRISDLASQYVASRAGEQLVLVHQTVSALLDLAEASAAESALRTEAEDDGCPSHYFPKFAYRVTGGDLTGSFGNERLHLEAYFQKLESKGFPPTSEHRKRLARLAG